MKKRRKLCLLLLTGIFACACYGQGNIEDSNSRLNDSTQIENNTDFHFPFLDGIPDNQKPLSQFIRRIFQAKNGDLWFGTNGDGVIRYNGKSVEYFSLHEGFGGAAVRGIREDTVGNIWFATSGGLTKYDLLASQGKAAPVYINYTISDGLVANDCWSLMIDNQGVLWVGTINGVSKFDGNEFTEFPLPESEIDLLRGISGTRVVNSIMQDSHGEIWFGTNGGAYIFNPDVPNGNEIITLKNISEREGLCNNSVNCILEDRSGNIWFATHHKGVSKYNPRDKSFQNFTLNGVISGDEVWSIYEDSKGKIWFPAEGYGVYSYNPEEENPEKAFSNYGRNEGLASGAIQCIFEDNEGRFWLGGHMGLFRLNNKASSPSFFSVTANGPWGLN